MTDAKGVMARAVCEVICASIRSIRTFRESLTPELRRLLPAQNPDTREHQFELPSKEDLQRFLEDKRQEMSDRG